MPTPYEPVTLREPWRLGNAVGTYFNTGNALSDPEAYSDHTAMWASDFTGTGGMADRLVVQPAHEFALIAWRFYGSDAAGQVALGRIWGVVEGVGASSEVVGDYICDFELVLGAKEITGGGILPSSKKWARAVIATVDQAAFPGVRVVGTSRSGKAVAQAPGDSSPELIFDGLGYHAYILEISCANTVGLTSKQMSDAGVIYRTL